MSDAGLDTIDISQMVDAALSDAQRQYIDGFPEPLRERVYGRVKAALHTSARMQVEYCSQFGICQVALERLANAEQQCFEQERQHHALANRLVIAGAPFVMAHTLMGVGKQAFEKLRKAHGLSGPASRKGVDDAESARLYRLWETLGKPSDAEGFMRLHEASGHPLHVLWGLVQDWLHVQQQVDKTRRRGVKW